MLSSAGGWTAPGGKDRSQGDCVEAVRARSQLQRVNNGLALAYGANVLRFAASLRRCFSIGFPGTDLGPTAGSDPFLNFAKLWSRASWSSVADISITAQAERAREDIFLCVVKSNRHHSRTDLA